MRVAIVGGGLSGTIACLQLLRQCDEDVHVTLIERRSRQLNRGVAYSAQLTQQLLNVPAARMGLFPDAVGAFHDWSRSGPSPAAAPTDFLPRRQFGDFVQEQFHEALDRHPGRVSIVRAEAVSLRRCADGKLRAGLRNGDTVEADHVMLALGTAPPAHPPHMDKAAIAHPHYVEWPWKPGALSGIHPDRHVVFVGAGLTTVDLLLSLCDQGHRGPITVLSRRGKLPCMHAPGVPYAFTSPSPDAANARMLDLVRWLRGEVRSAGSTGVPWQSVMDAVRPHVQAWWRAMPLNEREVFLRHVRPFWEVHRHRMPAEVGARLDRLRSTGQLRIVAGRIVHVTADGDYLSVRIHGRATGREETIVAGHLINCTGPQSDSRRLDQPLLLDLLASGQAAWDDLHMGLRCMPDGTLIGADGHVTENVHLIGPMCKAALWECTAVPEIRDQVANVVEGIRRRMVATAVAGRSTAIIAAP